MVNITATTYTTNTVTAVPVEPPVTQVSVNTERQSKETATTSDGGAAANVSKAQIAEKTQVDTKDITNGTLTSEQRKQLSDPLTKLGEVIFKLGANGLPIIGRIISENPGTTNEGCNIEDAGKALAEFVEKLPNLKSEDEIKSAFNQLSDPVKSIIASEFKLIKTVADHGDLTIVAMALPDDSRKALREILVNAKKQCKPRGSQLITNQEASSVATTKAKLAEQMAGLTDPKILGASRQNAIKHFLKQIDPNDLKILKQEDIQGLIDLLDHSSTASEKAGLGHYLKDMDPAKIFMFAAPALALFGGLANALGLTHVPLIGSLINGILNLGSLFMTNGAQLAQMYTSLKMADLKTPPAAKKAA